MKPNDEVTIKELLYCLASAISDVDDGLSSIATTIHQDIAMGWLEMALGALTVLVTAKQGKHADDKALQQSTLTHLDHAQCHTDEAVLACCFREREPLDDDGLWHGHHATARIALYLAKVGIEKREQSDSNAT